MAKPRPLQLSVEERNQLESIIHARTLLAQVVTRARILLLKAGTESVDSIAEKVGLNRNSVLRCLKKYHAGGVDNAIFDAPGRGRNAEITDDEKAWIINVACQNPTNFGYAAETWTYAKLTSHINRINKYFAEVNEIPVVYHWKYKMDDFESSVGIAN